VSKGARDRGSVLMLMPAGVLVVLVLGAIAFDLSLVFLRQRQATSVAIDVANDVATVALDEATLRVTGEYRIDPDLAEIVALDLVEGSDLGAHVVDLDVQVVGPDVVRVEVQVAVDYVFARAIPGASAGTQVRGSATAQATPNGP
jgi:hypothetical protein